jgi:hypothetical protein
MKLYTEKWMGLEIIILSKISQVQKSKYCMVSPYVESRSKMIIITMGHKCKRRIGGWNQ